MERIDPRSLDTPEGRQRWLAARRQGIGASDAPGILGLSPYVTPLHVYLSKLGELDSQDNKVKRSGRLLEEVVARLYEEQTGRSIWYPESAITQHTSYPWMLASIDRYTHADGRLRDVQIKTTGHLSRDNWGQPGTDQVPDHVNLQCQHELAVIDGEVADVALLVAGQDLLVYHVPRNDLLIGKLIQIESDFWARVQRREAPAPDYQHPGTLELLKRMYGVNLSETLVIDEPEIQQVVRQYERLRSEESRIKEERDSLKARLLDRMGSAGLARLPDGTLLTRRLVQRGEYTVAASEYLDFRIRCPRVKGED